MTQKIKALTEKYYPLGVTLRHAIHQYPEPGFEEFKTAKLVADTLTAHGIEVKTGIAKTGVLGFIKGAQPGKTVLLRGDMDALAIDEKADVPYKSSRPGLMHACGHDGHTAGLVMAGLILNELKSRLRGNIKLMFQPAEETAGGAEPMIREGVLENPKADAAFGCHLWGLAKAGDIWIRPGPFMASHDEFKIRIIGKSGHAAQPQLTVDPIVMSAQIINAFQAVVSRRNNPLKPLVISIASIHGGEREVHNVIPDFVDMSGTIRTLDPGQREAIPREMERIMADITHSWGGEYKFQLFKGYPPLINDDAAIGLVQESTAKIVGQAQVKTAEQSMGAEDFAYLAEQVPSAFYFVGIMKGEPAVHHNPYFAWDDEILKISSATLSQIAVDYLSR